MLNRVTKIFDNNDDKTKEVSQDSSFKKDEKKSLFSEMTNLGTSVLD